MAFPARLALGLLLFSAPAGAQNLSVQNVLPDKVLPSGSTPQNNIELPKSSVTTNNILPEKPEKPAPNGNFLTRPFYDKKVTLLAGINAGAAILDDVSSRIVIERGGYERNPFIRPFVHNSATLAAESVAEVWLMAFVADRMKHSSHPLLRKTWWLPQTVNISAKVSGGIYNSVLLAR